MLCKNKKCNKGNFGKRCKFEPNRTQVYCCTDCLLEDMQTERYKRDVASKIKKEEAIKKKKLKESIKSHGDYIKDFQTIFNKFIRLRDKELPCISCGVTRAEDWHAGHYIATTHQYLRFNENNVNLQCSKCNTHLRGNLIPYRINLIKKIGLEAVEELENTRHKEFKVTIPEIKEQIDAYRKKIALLKSN
jgi:hypothetical protein